jgi:ankyrin repeat protein
MLKGLLPYIDEINKLDANNQTAAHIAAKYGELECLKILFANGINLEIADKFGLQVR